MIVIKENLAIIQDRIASAARRAGRDPASVSLVAVSKKKPLSAVLEAASAGQNIFGENYLQDAKEKILACPEKLSWHFIGHVQSNKAKAVAELFDMVETVDRLKLARALDKHARNCDRILSVLLQVNIGRDPKKSGVMPEDIEPLLTGISEFTNLRLKGFMTITPFMANPEDVRPFFRRLRRLAEDFQERGFFADIDQVQLSMGMSADFEIAIEEGATLVRVGTALFGPRPV